MKAYFIFLFSIMTLVLSGKEVICEGVYPGHLQGVAADENAIYWSFSGALVKTDHQGKRLASHIVQAHCGDLCVHQGKVYAAVCCGKFNQKNPAGKNFVYVYDAKSFALEKRIPVNEMIYGAGGITFNGKNFLVVGGLPKEEKQNLAAEYTPDFRLVRVIRFPWRSNKGIQTAQFIDGKYIFGVYDRPNAPTKICTPDMKIAAESFTDVSCGITFFPDGRCAHGRQYKKDKSLPGGGAALLFYSFTKDHQFIRNKTDHPRKKQ